MIIDRYLCMHHSEFECVHSGIETSRAVSFCSLLRAPCSASALEHLSHHLHQYHPHRMQGAMKRIEHETEVLERYDAEQGLGVVRVAEDDWGVPLALREREV